MSKPVTDSKRDSRIGIRDWGAFVEPRISMPEPRSHAADGACWVLILGMALGSLHFFYIHGLTNTYGDALAHMEGARRLFDSLAQGYVEIDSGWLTGCQLLGARLAWDGRLWRTGLEVSDVGMVS